MDACQQAVSEQELQSANIYDAVRLASERLSVARARELHEGIIAAIRDVHDVGELRATIRGMIERALQVVE